MHYDIRPGITVQWPLPLSMLPLSMLPLSIPPAAALVQRTFLLYLFREVWLKFRRHGTARCRPTDGQRRKAMTEAMRLAPAPEPRLIGGERIDEKTYCRFLSVCNWDPDRAASLLHKDFKWRVKYKPRLLRPSDMPTMCRQHAWVVLTKPVGRTGALWGVKKAITVESAESDSGSSGSSGSSSGSSSSSSLVSYSQWPHSRRLWPSPRQVALHPPHTRPPLMHWRYTRQGMPITLCKVGNWHPERCSHDERVRHVAYHMEHYLRRMPTCAGGTRRVQRCCFIMDMQGFKATLLPHIKAAIHVLRVHYPGRLGVACFINTPGCAMRRRRSAANVSLAVHALAVVSVCDANIILPRISADFHPVWKIISPWLDEEIISKTFFLPRNVADVDDAIEWVDKRRFPDPSADP